MNIEEINRSGASRLERIRVRNALNPMLWLSVAAPIVLLAAAWAFRDNTPIVWVLVILAVLATITAIGAYIYLLIKSPDRLQSEEYQLRQKELRMIYRRGRKPDIFDAGKEAPRVESPRSRIDFGEKA